MTPYAARIRSLSERSHRSHDELVELLGINSGWYFDLESYDDELTDTLDLAQVERLSSAFGVTLRQLVCPQMDFMSVGPPRLTLTELRDRLQLKVRQEGLDQIEDVVGWHLNDFLANPMSAWRHPIIFLQDVCAGLEIGDWMDVVPQELPAGTVLPPPAR